MILSNTFCEGITIQRGGKAVEIKKKSVIPVYGAMAAWVLYCAVFPLHRTWHFIALACFSALVFTVLSAIFPARTERIEIPVPPETTGDEAVDALLREGGTALGEMRGLEKTIRDEELRQKLAKIAEVVEAIFKKLREDPADYKQVRRFADYYLPTTIKLLHAYDRFGSGAAQGGNITGTMELIGTTLGTILDSYVKFYDSLFEHQALDIETDIAVLETMLQKEGLLSR